MNHTPRSGALLLTDALTHLELLEPAAAREPVRLMFRAGIELCADSRSLLGKPVNYLLELAEALVDEGQRSETTKNRDPGMGPEDVSRELVSEAVDVWRMQDGSILDGMTNVLAVVLPAHEAMIRARIAAETQQTRANHCKTLRQAFAESSDWKLRAAHAENALERAWGILEEMPDGLAKDTLTRALAGGEQ